MTTTTERRPKVLVNGTDPAEKCDFIPPPSKFQQWGTEFIASPELDEIANGLIQLHESRFHHLQEWTVRCLFKNKGGKGEAALGKCSKTNGALKFFAQAEFVIWLAADFLYGMEATNLQVEELIFHELMHAGYEEREAKDGTSVKVPAMVHHDWEGFCDEIIEYGLAFEDTKKLAMSFRQLGFDELDNEPEPVSPGVRRAAEKFRDSIAQMDDIESVTLSAGGRSATIPGGAKK